MKTETDSKERLDLSNDVVPAHFRLSEEQSSRGSVLCTLEGHAMGPFDEQNGNGRDYSVEVAKVGILGSEYVKRMLENHTLFGEPHHPGQERTEIWSNHVSHAINDMWLTEDEKYLDIRIDVLDTPSGRILKTLVDYGSSLGVSARAVGKTRRKGNGLEVVPEAYMFKTFDVVLNPGFEESRVSLVSEEKSQSFADAVSELLESDNSDLELLRAAIEYSDDEQAKRLIPQIDESLNRHDNSGDVDPNLVEINEQLERRCQRLEERIEHLHGRIAGMKRDGAKRDSVHANAMKQRDVAVLESVQMDEQMGEILRENKALESELNSLREECRELRAAAKDAEQESERSHNSLSRVLGSYKSLKCEYEHLKSKYDTIVEENGRLVDDVDMLTEEVGELRSRKPEQVVIERRYETQPEQVPVSESREIPTNGRVSTVRRKRRETAGSGAKLPRLESISESENRTALRPRLQIESPIVERQSVSINESFGGTSTSRTESLIRHLGGK